VLQPPLAEKLDDLIAERLAALPTSRDVSCYVRQGEIEDLREAS